VLEAESPNVAPDWPARDYEQALAHLRNPKRLGQGLLLIGTLALFLGVAGLMSLAPAPPS
jgi:hypothetical protein